MKNKIFKTKQQNYYMKEFLYFDGENYITFYILEIDFIKGTVLLDISKNGRFCRTEYDLILKENNWYFEYGCDFEKIFIKDFMEV